MAVMREKVVRGAFHHLDLVVAIDILTDREVACDGIKHTGSASDSTKKCSVLSIGSSKINDGLRSDRGDSSGKERQGGKELHDVDKWCVQKIFESCYIRELRDLLMTHITFL